MGLCQPGGGRVLFFVEGMQEIEIRLRTQSPEGPSGLADQATFSIGIQKNVAGVVMGAFIGAKAMLEEIALPRDPLGQHGAGLELEFGDPAMKGQAFAQHEEHMDVVGDEGGAQEGGVARFKRRTKDRGPRCAEVWPFHAMAYSRGRRRRQEEIGPV